MLYRRRRFLRDVAEREAAGESFWTTQWAWDIRNRVLLAVREAVSVLQVLNVLNKAAYFVKKDEGWTSLVTPLGVTGNFEEWLGACEDELVPSAMEAVVQAGREANLRERSGRSPAPFREDRLVVEWNRIMREDRLAFEMIDGRLIPFDSRGLHEEVVVPTVLLLGGAKGFDKAEAAYLDALREISEGHADDAITDAARALQETLLALGCEGKSLGPLVVSARKKGLLGGHDHVMTEALKSVVDWVNADRSTVGDAHVTTDAGVDDAWFTVHVVGALALRLSRGRRQV